MNKEQAKALREPFPAEVIGKLPKAGVLLDYVGHAATTDRLLQVDPEWTWEPFALDHQGLPAVDERGNLWIRLTVCGVTRIGVGDGKNPKELISDALRNGAMRFGVALDLWSKEDLSAVHAQADYLKLIADLPSITDLEVLRGLYNEANRQGWTDDLHAIQERAEAVKGAQNPSSK